MPTAAPQEVPLLVSAYEDSYRTYVASLSDVDRRLAELQTSEAAITQRIDEDQRRFSAFVQRTRAQEDALEGALRTSHRRRAVAQARRTDWDHRSAQLAADAERREALAAKDEALAAEEVYWRQLATEHRSALAALTPARPPGGPRAWRQLAASAAARATRSSLRSQPPQSSAAAALQVGESWTRAEDAVRRGDCGALLDVLEACPEVVRCIDSSGSTLLHVACETEPLSAAVVRCLLRGGVATDVRNGRGLTAFHLACLHEQSAAHAVKAALLAAGVPVDQEAASGETAAHLLASHDAFLPSVVFLVHHGADLRRRASVAGVWRTPLAVAEECAGEEAREVRAYLGVATPHEPGERR
ncbi:Ankyrin repeats (many copies) [Novymonas esmeraldas]|uniref:Ankyrin repeats (Many copies) n=1 Tax=Novymonas esmeraldas TaxID=1808958 RepID=A0AAW0EVS8_9TRYP